MRASEILVVHGNNLKKNPCGGRAMYDVPW